MKVLLVAINAKYIHTNNAVRLLKANSTFNPQILEYTIKDDIDHIVEEILYENVSVIAFSVYIWNVMIVQEIIDRLPSEKTIIIGGPEVSYEPSHFLKNEKIDFIVKGEGEITLEKLLTAINTDQNYKYIESISYRQNGKIYHNPLTEIKDLSTINAPYYFKEDIKHIPNKISYIESSRGCPYKCSYCLSSLEKSVRYFPVDEVKKAILYLMEKGSRTIKFLDRTFNANKNTFDLLKFIIDNNNHKTIFQFEITGDTLDKSIIEYINQNAPKGLMRFEIGIQSINYETNFLVDRFQNKEKLFNNIKLIEDAGVIDLHLDLIAGLPKEDKKSFKNTFDEVFRLGAKELQLGFLKMLRGTKIRLEAEKYDYIYNDNAPYEIKCNNYINEEDIKEIHLVEHMLEIYHNKGYFKDNMLNIILKSASPYEFLLEIGNHYINKNYSMKGYQVEDVYKRLFEIIDDQKQFLLEQDYLKRSKIKPKLFFKITITKEERNEVLTELSSTQNIPIHLLYKHSVIIRRSNTFFIAYYKNNECKTYIYKQKSR